MKPSFILLIILTAAALGIGMAACKKPEIAVYEVPKETLPPSQPLPGEGTQDKAVTVVWKVVPQGWSEQPASGMRKGTFTIAAEDQKMKGAELAITTFPGDVGGLLANVNRWRGQVQLAPVAEEALAAAVQSIEIDGHAGHLVDLVGGDSRILGVILPLAGETWFFKLSGPPVVVAGEQTRMQEFLAGLHVHKAGHDPASSARNTPSPRPGAVDKAPAAASQPKGITFEMPGHWQQLPPAPMRAASFRIVGNEEHAAGVSIVSLGGKAGGMVANINRWRGQLGLGPMAPQEIDASVEKVPAAGTATGGGGEFLMIFLAQGDAVEAQNRQAILAAILERNDHTWFVKMTGDLGTVEDEQPVFREFLKRLVLP